MLVVVYSWRSLLPFIFQIVLTFLLCFAYLWKIHVFWSFSFNHRPWHFKHQVASCIFDIFIFLSSKSFRFSIIYREGVPISKTLPSRSFSATIDFNSLYKDVFMPFPYTDLTLQELDFIFDVMHCWCTWFKNHHTPICFNQFMDILFLFSSKIRSFYSTIWKNLHNIHINELLPPWKSSPIKHLYLGHGPQSKPRAHTTFQHYLRGTRTLYDRSIVLQRSSGQEAILGYIHGYIHPPTILY